MKGSLRLPLYLVSFLFEEFDISLELVVSVSAVGILGDCDRSTVVTKESIRGSSCRTG